MLVVTRKVGESILIGDEIEITVVKATDGSTKLSINAPKNIKILRKELYEDISNENKNSTYIDIDVIKEIKK